MVKIYNKNEINELSKILKNNGVISVPTDTVYGLCSRINSSQAYNNLLNVKNRSKSKFFSIMCANIEQVKKIAIVNDLAEKLISEFMPGPITLILKKNREFPKSANKEIDTVAIRMATSKELEELIMLVGSPLFMTSANISGAKECKDIDEIVKSFPNIDGILEGSVNYGISSTIVDLTNNNIKIVRNGPIELKDILEKINC